MCLAWLDPAAWEQPVGTASLVLAMANQQHLIILYDCALITNVSFHVMTTITDLPQIIKALPADRRARFERIFDVDTAAGEVRIPLTMRPWVERHLGRVEDIEYQRIVCITNRFTLEGALFNPVRANRPMVLRDTDEQRGTNDAVHPSIEDVFAAPERTTAEDVFGRVRGKYCITTSNVARWDGQCAVLIFDEYDPLKFTRDRMRDYFATSLEWAQRAHAYDPQARNFVWMWNGGLKGGASIPHAHAQMGLGRGRPYAFVERLRRAATAYQCEHNANYFADLLAAHEDVGLGVAFAGLRGFFHLAANRSKDLWVYGAAFDQTLADALHDALRALIDHTGMGAFNVGVVMPPLFSPSGPSEGHLPPAPLPEGEGSEDWPGFPVLLRIGDRGSPHMISSDVGAMDLYGQSVIAADPFAVQVQLATTRSGR
jgi:hypothetical protein